MRLSPNKIDYLAEKLLQAIEAHREVHIQTNSDLVYRAIADVVYDNMKAEEAIDAEVDELLQEYRIEIQAREMDYGELRAKMKRELAKKKGFTL